MSSSLIFRYICKLLLFLFHKSKMIASKFAHLNKSRKSILHNAHWLVCLCIIFDLVLIGIDEKILLSLFYFFFGLKRARENENGYHSTIQWYFFFEFRINNTFIMHIQYILFNTRWRLQLFDSAINCVNKSAGYSCHAMPLSYIHYSVNSRRE